VSELFAFIDESGDEGFPAGELFRDPTAYRSKADNRTGPSPFFLICAVLIRSEDLETIRTVLDDVAARVHAQKPTKELHWRHLDYEAKRFTVAECAMLPFKIIATVACKPHVDKRLAPPLLYNYMTRLFLERACIEAKYQGRLLHPVFSNRSRTNYRDLERYVRSVLTEDKKVEQLGKIGSNQPGRDRLLQLADICAGAVENALERNRYNAIQAEHGVALLPRFRRIGGTIRGHGLKFYPEPDHVTAYDVSSVISWLDAK
jgi:hypothetical protein